MLSVNRKLKKFHLMTWDEVQPGHVIRIKEKEEFPADCLILNTLDAEDATCYVSGGLFDINQVIRKESF